MPASLPAGTAAPQRIAAPPDLPSCASVLEALPLHLLDGERGGGGGSPEALHGRLSPAALLGHLEACASCAAEHRFLRVAMASRPEPPHDLGLRILTRALTQGVAVPLRPGTVPARASSPSPRRFLSWSGTAAAAVLVLALGLSLVARGTVGTDEGEPALLAALEDGSYGWWGDEWMVAGAPYLEGLSDETLLVLAGGIAP